jgi:hypothetical protein
MYHTAYGVPAENSHEALVEWSKCWEVEWVLSVESDSHEVLVFQTPEHDKRTMTYIDIWRLFMYPIYECKAIGAPALIESLFESLFEPHFGHPSTGASASICSLFHEVATTRWEWGPFG